MTDRNLLVIDGSQGEGGGQVVRSSLTLAALSGAPVRVDGVRAGRKKPGLLRQHLTALQALVTICDGEVAGDAMGASSIEFRPGPVRGGDYHFHVGTAGSTMLVLQTILLPLLKAKERSRIVLEGGTHNPYAPPFDFIEKCYLPLLARMGANVTMVLERPGFYPAGGGRVRVEVEPAAKLQPIDIVERGKLELRRARAVVSGLPTNIADRELKALSAKLSWPDDAYAIETVPDPVGPGNVVMAELHSEHVCELFTSFGVQGVPSESVAGTLARQVRRYLAGTAPVGEFLTDQLLLPLAVAGGGSFRSTGLSRHSSTHVELLEQILGVTVAVRQHERDGVLVQVGTTAS
ncbi:MAG: RNA 3'-terminal phosphate cyclase [Planctomycetota bacterium]